jgi:hypothetical protein
MGSGELEKAVAYRPLENLVTQNSVPIFCVSKSHLALRPVKEKGACCCNGNEVVSWECCDKGYDSVLLFVYLVLPTYLFVSVLYN